jgi:hypothetical protein
VEESSDRGGLPLTTAAQWPFIVRTLPPALASCVRMPDQNEHLRLPLRDIRVCREFRTEVNGG